MPETPPPPKPEVHGKGVTGFLKESTAGLSNWAWLLIIAAGITAAVIIPKLFKGGNTTDSTVPPPTTDNSLVPPPTTDNNPLTQGGSNTPDLSGLTDLLKNFQTNMQNQGNDQTDTTKTDTTTTPKPTPELYFQTRPQGKAGDTSKDIPIRETPGGKIIKTVGFGQRITLTDSMVAGPNNYGPTAKSGTGSTHWYPVQGGGYISAFDVERHAAGSVGPIWPTTYIRSRHMKVGTNGR